MAVKKRFYPLVFGVLLIVFALGVATAPTVQRSFARPAEAAAKVYDPESIADIAASAAPAVVAVTGYASGAAKSGPRGDENALPPYQMPDPEPGEPAPKNAQSFGSGFIFRPDGYILTNAHVVEKASRVEVTLLNEGKPFPAKVIGRSGLLDLAVLKIEANKTLPVLNFGDSDGLRPGEWVVAIGNPLGYDHSVTAGVLSATGRRVQAGGSRRDQPRLYENLLQTDAAINPGNSGGPLLNLDGRVIGINSVVSAVGQGIGFAIPINTARDALEQLIRTGRYSRPWMGVRIIDLSSLEEDARRKYQAPAEGGVFIAGVEKGSPANRAGLAPGDVVLKIAGQRVQDTDALIAAVRRHKVGETIQIDLLRRGKEMALALTLAEQPD